MVFQDLTQRNMSDNWTDAKSAHKDMKLLWTGSTLFSFKDEVYDDWTGYTCVSGQTPSRPITIMEVCTKTGRVSQEAVDRGWCSCSPVTIETGFDLTSTDGCFKAWKYIAEQQPDVLVLAWPCDPWSS